MEIISWTKHALTTMGYFLAACRNGKAWHSFGHVQFVYHFGGILVPLPTGVLGDNEVLGLYDIIRIAGFDPVKCLLAARRSQEIDWSGYGVDSTPFFGYESKSGLAYVISTLRATERSETDSDVIFDISGYDTSCLQDSQLANITSCDAERAEYGGALGLDGGPQVVVFDPPVLDDLELLF